MNVVVTKDEDFGVQKNLLLLTASTRGSVRMWRTKDQNMLASLSCHG